MSLVTLAGPVLAAAVAGLTGSGGTQYKLFDNTNAHIGVGDTNTAFDLADTNLKAAATSSNRSFKPMDASYPSRSGNELTYRATFGTSDANFAWEELAIANADLSALAPGSSPTAPDAIISRYVDSMGTKTSAQTWQVEVVLELVIA